jgi:hypothetical protein
MEVEGGGDESAGGGEGGSELSGLSPLGDEGEDGGGEPAEELPASCGEPSSRTRSEPRPRGLREGRAPGQGCWGGKDGSSWE